MTENLVSICVVTLDRFDLAAKCVGPALANCGYGMYELLCCDNGSQDRRVIDYIASLNPVWHRLNPDNRGYGPCLNQMMLRANGEFIAIIDPDISLPAGWLARLVDTYKYVVSQGVDAGIAGIHCVEQLWPERQVGELTIHAGWHTFGIKFFRRELLSRVGYYHEAFQPYGLEDVHVNHRINRMGLTNFYLHGMEALHEGNDVGDQSEYRKMKWDCLARLGPILNADIVRMDNERNWFVGPPEKWDG